MRLYSGQEGFVFGGYDYDGLPASISVPGDGVYSFLYDQDGRPVRVTLPSGQYVDYAYDHEGRLARRSASEGDTRFTYGPGGESILESDAAGAVLRYRLPGISEVVYARGGGTAPSGIQRVIAESPRGDAIAMYDVARNRDSRMAYRAFGEEQPVEGTHYLSSSRFGGRTGGWKDPASGLVLFGARWYSPRLGRWLTPDPIGQKGGSNLYAYCGNDPVNRTDPAGTEDGYWNQVGQVFQGYVDVLNPVSMVRGAIAMGMNYARRFSDNPFTAGAMSSGDWAVGTWNTLTNWDTPRDFGRSWMTGSMMAFDAAAPFASGLSAGRVAITEYGYNLSTKADLFHKIGIESAANTIRYGKMSRGSKGSFNYSLEGEVYNSVNNRTYKGTFEASGYKQKNGGFKLTHALFRPHK